MAEDFDLDAASADPMEDGGYDAGASVSGQDAGAAQDIDNDNQNVIDTMLVAAGINDPRNIKFATSDGQIVERDWRELSMEEKLGILAENNRGLGLSKDEINMVNDMRGRGMSPEEYVGAVYQRGRMSAEGQQEREYSTDSMTDDQLFLLDAIAKYGEDNITDDELETLLDNAKSDPQLYAKTIAALRQEYNEREDELDRQEQEERKADYEKTRKAFNKTMLDGISRFRKNNFVELSQNDLNDIANFMLTEDAAGNTEMNKALNDPDMAVRMAFWAVKGNDVINEFNAQLNEAYRAGIERGMAGRTQVVSKQPAKAGRGGQRSSRGVDARGLDVQ